MIRDIEEQFFKEYRLGGIAHIALDIVKQNYDLNTYPVTKNSSQQQAEYYDNEYKDNLKAREDAFDESILVTPKSAVIEEIRANVESSTGLQRERYLISLLTPFKDISDLMHPDKSIYREFQERKDELVADIKQWEQVDDKDEANGQIDAGKQMAEQLDKDYQRQVEISKRMQELCHLSYSDDNYKDDYALSVWVRFWRLLHMYANRLDAVLLETGIDIMTIQQNAGIWILTRRDISSLQYYCGSMQLARKYIDELPKADIQSIVSSIPPALSTPEAKEILDKLIEDGFCIVNGQAYKWIGQANELAAFIDCSSTALKIRPSNNRVPWKLYKQMFNLSDKEIKAAQDAKKDYDMERRSKPDKWNLICNICNI